MRVEIREADGVHVVSVVGELDLLSSASFFECVREVAGRPKARVVLDLGALTFLDSMGAGQLWKTVQGVREGGGTAAFAAVPEFVRKLFDSIGFSAEVEVFPTVEEAVRRLRA